MTITADEARSKIAAALGELVAGGNSAGNVADALKKRGITGERGNCQTCPIAVYLRNELDREDFTSIFVDPEIMNAVVITPLGTRMVTVSLPRAVTRFIGAFDYDGSYGDLAVS